MRDFFINNGLIIAAVAAVAELLLTILLLADFARKKTALPLIMALVAIGLVFDAAVLAMGTIIPEGVLPHLSRARYVIHGLLVPLNLVICALAMKWDGIKLGIVWVITAVIAVAGAASGFARVLELVDFAGIIRHVSADSTPAWAENIDRLLSFGTVLPLIAAGIYIWIKQKTPAIFLAGVLMFASAAIAPATGNVDLIFLISMLGELCMIIFFYVYAKKQAANSEELY